MKRYILPVVFLMTFNLLAFRVHAASCPTADISVSTQFGSAWETLTAKQKQSWSDWAKANQIYLESGILCSVNGRQAFDVIMRNRTTAGDILNPWRIPAKSSWLRGALSLRDAGPFTENAGYMGFRVEQSMTNPTKWFVDATAPTFESTLNPLAQFRFIKSVSLGVMEYDDITSDFAPEYRSLYGSFNSPGGDGEWWWPEKFIWFRVHQYYDGQLGPGVILKGRIQVEL